MSLQKSFGPSHALQLNTLTWFVGFMFKFNRMMGWLGLNGGIPWLSNTNGALSFVCKSYIETLDHFLFNCPAFRQNFGMVWSDLSNVFLSNFILTQWIFVRHPYADIRLLFVRDSSDSDFKLRHFSTANHTPYFMPFLLFVREFFQRNSC